jgi:hypothetical protein
MQVRWTSVAGSDSSLAGGGRSWWLPRAHRLEPAAAGGQSCWLPVLRTANPAAWAGSWWSLPSFPTRSASPRWNGSSRSSASLLPMVGEARGLCGSSCRGSSRWWGCPCAGRVGGWAVSAPLNRRFIPTPAGRWWWARRGREPRQLRDLGTEVSLVVRAASVVGCRLRGISAAR